MRCSGVRTLWRVVTQWQVVMLWQVVTMWQVVTLLGSRAQLPAALLSVDSLMDLINGTSQVYRPHNHSNVPAYLQPTEETVRQAGYSVEVHRIHAEDGQMLTLHRIPGRGLPVLVMHGFMGSSQTWLIGPPGKALPYLLADQGYDVWLGNFRTNYYSRSHLKYSPKDRRFWDVSFHEMGVLDIPAMTDYILHKTGSEQLVYIGHSMGTTAFLVMASLRPQYNSKIMVSFLLSPVALTIKSSQLPPLLSNFLAPNADLIYKSMTKLRSYELFPRNEYLYRLLDMSCGPSPLQPVCLQFIAQGYGEHRDNIQLKEFGKDVVALIAGTSLKVAHHLSQLFDTGEFRLYDHGAKMNEFKYGSSSPPRYPLDRVTAPVILSYGLNDVLMNTRSVHRLAKALPNVLSVSAAEDPQFTHLDYLMGNNVKQVVYDDILQQISNFQKLN